MNAVNSCKFIPKFLRVVSDIDKKFRVNKFFIRPLVPGEIVKVAPLEEQVPDKDSMTDVENFRKKYVVVYRKSSDGSWDFKCCFLRSHFEKLGK